MKRYNKNIARWVIILSGGFLLLLTIVLALPTYIERSIREKIYLHNANASDIKVDFLTRSIQIKNLEWKTVPDSLDRSHSFKINTLNIHGINLYQLMTTDTIRVKEITLDGGNIQWNNNIKKYIREANTSKFTTLECASFSLSRIETQVMTDTVETVSARIYFHLTDATLSLDSTNTLNYSAKNTDGLFREINFSRHEGMYGGTIRKLAFNTKEQRVTIDCVLLIPNFGKYKFAQYLGEQAGRVNISIPKISLEGVAFDSLLDSTLIINKIKIQSFDLYSFKDKRVPFLRTENIPLPMESFINLSWKVKIDSVMIASSRLTIEEFPEDGDERTIIKFADVSASLTGLNNRISKNENPYALLDVHALLMGSAKTHAVFQLPLDGKSDYTAKGKVSKFYLAELNPLFIPIANIRIESGYLNSLTFDFRYTEFNSKGELDIDYENLKLLGLNKNNPRTHELKTLFISFFVKKNRDQSGKHAKAVGIIDIERDQRRFIFNTWWRSILDGLKSSILGHGKSNKKKQSNPEQNNS